MRDGHCPQHNILAQLICLHSSCRNRLMCMLCQHNHELYPSIRTKQQVEFKYFKKKVDEIVDQSIQILDELFHTDIEQQKNKVIHYYQTTKNALTSFLDDKMAQNLALFKPNANSDVQVIVKSRIQGKYHQLPPQIFYKIKEIYEGKDLSALAKEQQQRNLETVYHFMKDAHGIWKELFEKLQIQTKVEIPEIRFQQPSTTIKNQKIFDIGSYDTEQQRPNLQQQLKYITNIEIDQILTDSHSDPNKILTTSFDKTLRVFNKNLQLLQSKQFHNILTKIQKIGEDIFALGVSKQLHIIKVSSSDGYEPKLILGLKGHTERIWDISAFNTRIIGSCSDEGTKIWDLYKQKCQYTVKQQINPSCLAFMTQTNILAIGYYNHELKIYSVQKMKLSRKYELNGVPLQLRHAARKQNLVYCGGFSSHLNLFDIRVSQEVLTVNLKSEAITTFSQSLLSEDTILIGERGGKARVFDLRGPKTRVQWQAHSKTKTTNLSKPNGIVRIFQQSQNQLLTVGCNDRKAIIWQLHTHP